MPRSNPSWSRWSLRRRGNSLLRWVLLEPGLDVLARVGFDTLGLQTFLTAGPKESRAWTIRKGAAAPEAAGVIHRFQKGLHQGLRVSFDDLVSAGSMQNAREEARCGWRARITSWPTVMSSNSASHQCRRNR